MRATLFSMLVLVGSGAALAQDTAGDPEAGRRGAGMCQSCHGMDGGMGSPRTPRIGGQPAAYLVEQLRANRSGERKNEMMNGVTRFLTDDEIEEVAAWCASLDATAVLPEGYSMTAALDQCFGCHGPNGIARAEGAPNGGGPRGGGGLVLVGRPGGVGAVGRGPGIKARGDNGGEHDGGEANHLSAFGA